MSDIHTVHATTVAIEGRAALIRGASGSGKSGLALQLLALGAALVSDDRTRLWRRDDRLWGDAPETIRGQIEARGVGILQVPPHGPCQVALVIDMDAVETKRLPERDHTRILDIALPRLKKCESAHFPAAVALYLETLEFD